MRHHVDLNGRRYTGFGRLNVISYDDVGRLFICHMSCWKLFNSLLVWSDKERCT